MTSFGSGGTPLEIAEKIEKLYPSLNQDDKSKAQKQLQGLMKDEAMSPTERKAIQGVMGRIGKPVEKETMTLVDVTPQERAAIEKDDKEIARLVAKFKITANEKGNQGVDKHALFEKLCQIEGLTPDQVRRVAPAVLANDITKISKDAKPIDELTKEGK